MGFRFYRRKKLFPGVTVNFSKSGLSLSLGTRGAKITVGPKGTRSTVGIPGTGLFYSESNSYKSQKAQVPNIAQDPGDPRHGALYYPFVLLLLLAVIGGISGLVASLFSR